MSRSLPEFLIHIKEECEFLLKATEGKTYSDVFEDDTLKRAVVRSIEIIGEASKKLDSDFKSKHPQIEWKKMAGSRDVMIHDYFGIDYEIVWNIIEEKIPELLFQINAILETN